MPRNELKNVVPDLGKDGTIQVEVTLPLRHRHRESGQNGATDSVSKPASVPHVPRITRLMALAIKFQDIVDCGEVRDYADLARLGYVSRARITQIMNLLNLAPNIQELLLFLPPARDPRAEISEPLLRKLCTETAWDMQRQAWLHLARTRIDGK